MSILLDALRKSEEQRRLGTTPTLQTPESSVDFKPGEQLNWIPAVMMLLTVATIAWIGLAQFERPAPVLAVELSPAPSESLPTDISLRAETTQEALDSLAKSPEVAPATTPVMDFAAEPQSSDLEAVQEEADQPGHASQEVRNESPDDLASARGDRVAREKAGEQRGAPSAPGAAAGEEPIAALVEDLSVSDVAARPDADQLQPYTAEPISYWQIPQSLRETMPEMRITVLVYAVNPQDRFVLINGKRLREKEEVSNGLVLEEIQRDRAIFTYRDYRFQVKS